jgi:transcription elongation factor SPT4
MADAAPAPAHLEPSRDPADFLLTNKSLRACFACRLVKSYKQFQEQGCDNCINLIKDDSVAEFTTQRFSGLITLMAPQASWAGKWLHLEHCMPGAYAMALDEAPDEEVEDAIERAGIKRRLGPN